MIALKGAIFDLDGTLLDSMPIWETVGSEFLKSRGIVAKPDLLDSLRALSGKQVAEHFRSDYFMTDSVEEILSGINSIMEDYYFNRATLKDGVLEMLQALQRRGVKMCVATATDRHLVEGGLESAGISSFFECIFTCTEAGSGKDAPDIYLQALHCLGTDKKDTIIFEDALYAIKTAKKEGFTVAALYDHSTHSQQQIISQLADYYFKSFTEWNKSNA